MHFVKARRINKHTHFVWVTSFRLMPRSTKIVHNFQLFWFAIRDRGPIELMSRVFLERQENDRKKNNSNHKRDGFVNSFLAFIRDWQAISEIQLIRVHTKCVMTVQFFLNICVNRWVYGGSNNSPEIELVLRFCLFPIFPWVLFLNAISQEK